MGQREIFDAQDWGRRLRQADTKEEFLGLIDELPEENANGNEDDSLLEELQNIFMEGVSLFYGIGEPQDTARGLILLEKAGLSGHCEAAFLAGDIIAGGYNCEKDMTKARILFIAAFIKGSDQAGRYLIPIFKNGLGGPKDIPQLLKMLHYFVECHDDVTACSALGHMYLYGDDVDVDHAEAQKWLLKAAEKGDVTAQYNLSILYCSPGGEFFDLGKSEHWTRTAAANGDERSQKLVVQWDASEENDH